MVALSPEEYGRISRQGRRERKPADRAPLPLPEPTDAMPGSPEKVEILRARVQSKLSLWHPNDEVLELEALWRAMLERQAALEQRANGRFIRNPIDDAEEEE